MGVKDGFRDPGPYPDGKRGDLLNDVNVLNKEHPLVTQEQIYSAHKPQPTPLPEHRMLM